MIFKSWWNFLSLPYIFILNSNLGAILATVAFLSFKSAVFVYDNF